jgi:hypothetical protein
MAYFKRLSVSISIDCVESNSRKSKETKRERGIEESGPVLIEALFHYVSMGVEHTTSNSSKGSRCLE